MAKGKRRATGADPATPVTQTLGPQRRATRAAERERRRRQRRRRTTVFGVVAAVVAVAVVALLVGRAVTGDKDPVAPASRTQRTLLFSVTGDSGGGRATTLLAYDAAPRRASVVLIPPNTLSDVAGIGNVVLGTALRLGGPTAARESVSDLMGVTVDHDWTLTHTGFVALVDRVGGVVVDVDVDVVTGPALLVRAGPGQRLDGATALAYATYVPKGEDQITFQARFQRVMEALLGALPETPDEVAAFLIALGPGHQTSWEPRALAEFLIGVRTAQAEDRYEPQVLPVVPIDTGADTPTFRINVEGVKTLVDNQLAASIPPGRDDGNNRVMILNGVGTPGLGGEVGDKLRNTEFRLVGTRNKQGFGEEVSVVVVFDNTDESLAKARRVAELVGLPETAVRTSTLSQSVADIVVVVGADYKR
jgi:hypothetical protein